MCHTIFYFDELFKFLGKKNYISLNKWKQITSFFPFDLWAVVDTINSNFKQQFIVCDHISLDESMWPWRGEHPASKYIERKPEPWGFKVIAIAGVCTK